MDHYVSSYLNTQHKYQNYFPNISIGISLQESLPKEYKW